ncbi:LuxR C-terminal-related transcriptional regulator [Nocardioides sp. TF02-7]|uniref:LuxR C-terminal-related transcriptional regulator n=1 Tax=Nocardioides sp. TF02-7 TaxID=2917724 RepID=UPI001F066E13|nr:LuxR C-terminal-related transcriptional regulator [Nocardioides sp. TF02-7]UMG94741.1 LuxR C-terminal-related transcriptional regulator [Nocardioides sp. TF02-7]
MLRLIAAGLSDAAIADQLHLALTTAERTCTRIFAKLDLHPSQHFDRRVLAVLVLLREG